MSRGLGVTQRAIVEALRESDYPWLSVAELAERLDRSDRQVRQAVRSLATRGIVTAESGLIDWHGRGDYGRLVVRSFGIGPSVPTALVLNRGDRWPYSRCLIAPRDGVEFVRQGMPSHGLRVALCVPAG